MARKIKKMKNVFLGKLNDNYIVHGRKEILSTIKWFTNATPVHTWPEISLFCFHEVKYFAFLI